MSAERQRQNRLQGRFSGPKRKSNSPLQAQNQSPISPDTSIGSSASPVLRYSKTDWEVEEKPKEPIVLNDCPERIRTWVTISETENGKSEIYFDPDFLISERADYYFGALQYPHIDWKLKDVVVRGEKYSQPRLVHWVGPYDYSYTSLTLEANDKWADPVLEIRSELSKVQRIKDDQVGFNSVLLNMYRNEKDSVAWHSDDELSMGVKPFIASVSLGDRRRFELKRKIPRDKVQVGCQTSYTNPEYLVHLNHGSLLIMNGALQDDWLHRVPKEPNDRQCRINLTFRTVFKV